MTLDTFIENIRETLTQQTVGFCLKLMGGVLLLGVGFRLIHWMMKLLERSKLKQKMDPTAYTFVRSLLSLGLKVLLIIVSAGLVGVPTASIIAVLGSAGVAVGLALQGSLSNLAGGVMLLWNKPFEKGDYIEVPGVTPGSVTDITVFYTTLRTLDNRMVVIPNGTVSNAALTNYSALKERRVELDFSVAYEADVDAARACILGAAAGQEGILPDPAPAVLLTQMGDSAVILQYQGWCKSEDYIRCKYAVNELVKKALDGAGISIPYPQLDVHMK